uniref:Sideroflexin-4 n=1 Tax=Steinernema glaseri TaxID=37863 RepID=A0A1I7YZT7_9BILA
MFAKSDGTYSPGLIVLDSKKYKNLTIKGDQTGTLEEFQDKVYRSSQHYKDIATKFNPSKEHPDLSPLDEETFAKGLACEKYAGLLMLPYTAFEIRAYNTVSVDDFRPLTFFKRYFQVARIPVTVAFTWGSTLSFAANLRHKDDFYNHYFASAAVGTVVVAMKDNIALGVTSAVVSTVLGIFWQYIRISDTGLQSMVGNQAVGGTWGGPFVHKFLSQGDVEVPTTRY